MLARSRAGQVDLQRDDDGVRDLVLKVKDVCEVTVVALRPEVKPRRGVDQLGVDPDAVRRARTLPSST